MKRKICNLFMLVAVTTFVFTMSVFATADSGFAGGDGSATNPYQIATKEQLNNVRNHPNGNFKLVNDIVFEAADFAEGGEFYNLDTTMHISETIKDCGWIPIPEINGTFDGNNHAIVNLQASHRIVNAWEGIYTNSTFVEKIGATGTVKNLYVKNCDFLGNEMGGATGICSKNYGTIENCTVSGKLNTYYHTNVYVAGIAVRNYGTIRDCANFATTNIDMTDVAHYGGITCENQGSVENCVNAGGVNKANISATNGIALSMYMAGIAEESFGTIKSTVNLNGFADGKFAGVVQKNTGTVENTINCIGTAQYRTFDLKDDGIKSLTRDQINIRNYTSNPIAIKYFENFNVSENVQNLQAEGYTYKSIKLSWNSVQNAGKYIIFRGEKHTWDNELHKALLPIAQIDAKEDCSYIDNEIAANSPIDYFYAVAPVFSYDGVEVIGVHTKTANAKVVNTETSTGSTDTMGPYVDTVQLFSMEAYKPGAIRVRVKAADNENSIVKIEFKMYSHHDYAIIGFSDVLEGDYGKSFDRTFDVSVGREVESGNYRIGYIALTDAVGNTTYCSASSLDPTVVAVQDEFDIEFKGVLSNVNIPRELSAMDEGKTVVLTIDDASKGVLKKEILDAIKGQDKTVVVYVDEQGSAQWVFYGKDIIGKTKDLKLKVKINKIKGSLLGLDSNVLEMVYEDNGQLPGKTNFRLKSDYLSAIHKVNSEFFLYYKNGNKVELEKSTCTAIRDGSACWCYVDLTHNSTFYLTGEKVKSNKVESKFSNCKVSLSSGSYVYNGKVKNPKVIVKNDKGKILNKGTDYTVKTPKGRKNIGEYTYIVKFKGQYSGEKKVTLTIKPAKPTNKTPKAAKKTVTVKWKGVKKVHATGYQVMVATDKKFTKNVKSAYVKGYNKTSKKMTKLKTKKTYYVRVRTYKTVKANGKSKKIYSAWSSVKNCKTK
ncbi:MAG: hypothetical protein IKJ77_07295 [Firmicutes bacterium]|nr:hypothetical protein [Bacillota bacterium]